MLLLKQRYKLTDRLMYTMGNAYVLFREKCDKPSSQIKLVRGNPKRSLSIEGILNQLKNVHLLEEELDTSKYTDIPKYYLEKDIVTLKTIISEAEIVDVGGFLEITSEVGIDTYFRGNCYLTIDTIKIYVILSKNGDDCFLYIFIPRKVYKVLYELEKKLEGIGLDFFNVVLTPEKLDELGNHLNATYLNTTIENVSATERKVTIIGKGYQDDNGSLYKDVIKSRPSSMVSKHKMEIQHLLGRSNKDKLTLFFNKDCYIHSYNNLPYSKFFDFIKVHVLPYTQVEYYANHSLTSHINEDIYKPE